MGCRLEADNATDTLCLQYLSPEDESCLRGRSLATGLATHPVLVVHFSRYGNGNGKGSIHLHSPSSPLPCDHVFLSYIREDDDWHTISQRVCALSGDDVQDVNALAAIVNNNNYSILERPAPSVPPLETVAIAEEVTAGDKTISPPPAPNNIDNIENIRPPPSVFTKFRNVYPEINPTKLWDNILHRTAKSHGMALLGIERSVVPSGAAGASAGGQGELSLFRGKGTPSAK